MLQQPGKQNLDLGLRSICCNNKPLSYHKMYWLTIALFTFTLCKAAFFTFVLLQDEEHCSMKHMFELYASLDYAVLLLMLYLFWQRTEEKKITRNYDLMPQGPLLSVDMPFDTILNPHNSPDAPLYKLTAVLNLGTIIVCYYLLFNLGECNTYYWGLYVEIGAGIYGLFLVLMILYGLFGMSTERSGPCGMCMVSYRTCCKTPDERIARRRYFNGLSDEAEA